MTPLTQTADVAIPELAGLQRRLLVAGAIGAVVSLVGLFLDTRQFMQSKRTAAARAQALADILWALLNSSEFVLNH